MDIFADAVLDKKLRMRIAAMGGEEIALGGIDAGRVLSGSCSAHFALCVHKHDLDGGT